MCCARLLLRSVGAVGAGAGAGVVLQGQARRDISNRSGCAEAPVRRGGTEGPAGRYTGGRHRVRRSIVPFHSGVPGAWMAWRVYGAGWFVQGGVFRAC